MIYRVEELESRLRSGEDSVWEFKQVELARDYPKRPTHGDQPLSSISMPGEVVDNHAFAPERQRIKRIGGMCKEI